MDDFKDFNFKRVGGAKLDAVYLHLLYEGGDADTRHPVKIKLPFKFSEYKEHVGEIREIIRKYKILGHTLDVNHRDYCDNDYKRVEKKFGLEIARLYDDVPNDPQSDFQYKCYLDSMKLISYDQEGNKYESYV